MKTRSKILRALLAVVLLLATASATAGELFETRGTAVIRLSGAVTTKIEKRDIPVPGLINTEVGSGWSDLEPDSRSGWTKCRLPMKGEVSWQGKLSREMVFDCRKVR